MFGSCEEYMASASEWMDDEMTWMARLRLKAHLLMCKHCARYFKQLEAICGALGPATKDESPDDFAEDGERLLDKMFADES